ncbi:MAG: hypothetical protein GXY15_03790 [Candidatus Hydrogenedentes bacterium]|nr:hypothetical protein [Candidatus Hydrogenedentota bacterium]
MAEPVKHARTRSVLLWAGLFALALALRVFRLDGQSLFWDDYNGLVGLAEPGLVDSILAARDVNPEGMPLYHVVQYLFRGLIGGSPPAMRGLSIAIGLATLPFVCAAASAAFGRRVPSSSPPWRSCTRTSSACCFPARRAPRGWRREDASLERRARATWCWSAAMATRRKTWGCSPQICPPTA